MRIVQWHTKFQQIHSVYHFRGFCFFLRICVSGPESAARILCVAFEKQFLYIGHIRYNSTCVISVRYSAVWCVWFSSLCVCPINTKLIYLQKAPIETTVLYILL